MSNVINQFNREINYGAAVYLMDDDIREALHGTIGLDNDQAFFDAYCASHLDKFDETFELNKSNPVW